MISTITIADQSIQLVATPSCAVFESYEMSMMDAVAVDASPFTGQAQTQQWLGADALSGTMNAWPMTTWESAEWKAFLAQLRGMANAFQLQIADYKGPRGTPLGSPAIPGTVTNVAGDQGLATTGWTPNKTGLLLRGDWQQVGYRLHMVLDPVTSDASGNATIAVWPSLREAPTADEPIILNNPRGLFRLGKNQRGWGVDQSRLSRMSFPIVEYR